MASTAKRDASDDARRERDDGSTARERARGERACDARADDARRVDAREKRTGRNCIVLRRRAIWMRARDARTGETDARGRRDGKKV